MRGLLCAGVLAALLSVAPARAQYQLVWQDEFDGTQLDLAKWQPQIGTGCPSLCGWGNNELQYYRAENATVAGGFLTITAKQEAFGGQSYTSARLRTRNLGDWKYGRFEMRAKMPIGKGLWPALWMLPTDNVYGAWAASGEIDILEYLGHDPDRVFGTIHYGGTYPANQFSSSGFTLGAGTFHDAFHVFALEWDECSLRWYVDGALYAEQKSWSSAGGPYPAPFDQRFHLLLNLAVGGNLPGPPDGSTSFPQQLVVDWVRVYQESSLDLGPCVTLFDGMEHGNPFGNNWFSFGGSVGGGGIAANFVDVEPVEGCDVSLQTGWGSGGTPGFFGGFGRGNPLRLDDRTHFTFWINPDAGQSYRLEINLQDDDNGDNSIPGTPNGLDDEFQFNCLVGPAGPHAISGGGWQRVSIPLASFADDNSFHFGGNGVFDPIPASAGGNGQLITVVFVVQSLSGADVTFRTDRWTFTRQTSSVSGRVWSDSDHDGVQDGGEGGLAGVAVELVDAARGTVVAATATSGSGDYGFVDLLGGSYEVRVVPATLPAGVVPTADPDGTATANRFAAEVGCEETAAGRDFGYGPDTTGAPDGPRPGTGTLLQNVPNPFDPDTVIRFELAREGPIELSIHDVTGRLIKALLREWRPAGANVAGWDGTDAEGRPVAAGVYFTRLRTEQDQSIRKMIRLR